MEDSMNKKLIIFLMVIVMMISLLGCSSQETEEPSSENPVEEVEEELNEENDSIFPVKIVDGYGVEFTVEEKPEKVVSMAPSFTETLFAIGAGDKVVGVTQFCNYPEEAKEIEEIGDSEGPNLEKIIGLNPDLVLALYMSEEERGKLEDAGINVLLYDPQDIESVFNSIETVGLAMGLQDETEELLSNMKSKKERIVEKVEEAESKKVFYEVWHEPLMTAGPGSFIDQLIGLANGENIAYDAESAYPEYSLELLLERNPQVYLTSDDGFKTVDDIINRNGYENIEAVQENNIYLLHPDITTRTGPRIIDGLEMIAQAIHPEVFEGK
jgi:iron complex transport system substrate-binding protein